MEVLLAELAGVDPSEITRDIVFQGKVDVPIIDNNYFDQNDYVRD